MHSRLRTLNPTILVILNKNNFSDMFFSFVAFAASAKIAQTDGMEVLSRDSGPIVNVQQQANQLVVFAENLKSCHLKGPLLMSFKATNQKGELVCDIDLPILTQITFPSSIDLVIVSNKVETITLTNVPTKIEILVSDIEEEPFEKLKAIHHTFGGSEESGKWFSSVIASVLCLLIPSMYLLVQMTRMRYSIYMSGLLFLLLICLHLFINFHFWLRGSLFPTLFNHFFVGLGTVLVGHRALTDRIKMHK